MPKFYMMVGLPGAGKSTYAKQLAEKNDAHYIASDDYREAYLHDIENQDQNDYIFQKMKEDTMYSLSNDKDVVYDATNISYKKRRRFLQEIKAITCEKYCIVMATPYEQCLENNANRDRCVPEYVIERMYKSFYMPYYYEGWNYIELIYPSTYTHQDDAFEGFIWPMWNFDQENPHHMRTLGKHCSDVYMNCKHWTQNQVTLTAAELHDCGKPFTKSFMNSKGEYTTVAHYYGHQHVGAYDSMFYNSPDPIQVAVIIQWHMMPFVWEAKENDKLKDKYRRLWGDELYEQIMLVHAADKISTC